MEKEREPMDVERTLRELETKWLKEGASPTQWVLSYRTACEHHADELKAVREALLSAPSPEVDSGRDARERCIGENLPAGWIEKQGMVDPSTVEGESAPSPVEDKGARIEYEGKRVTLEEVRIFNDSCIHESFTTCDRCLCDWINAKLAQQDKPAPDRKMEAVLYGVERCRESLSDYDYRRITQKLRDEYPGEWGIPPAPGQDAVRLDEPQRLIKAMRKRRIYSLDQEYVYSYGWEDAKSDSLAAPPANKGEK